MTSVVSNTNGVMSPPQSVRSAAHQSPRVILAGSSARILCVADIRGDYHELNRLIRYHEATAVIHTGDFGFLNADSLERMGDKILRHLLQYSPLIAQGTRNQLLSIPPQAGRAALLNQLNSSSVHFPLSQFPLLLSGSITFPVPVFTVWGLIEDVRIVEKFRTGEYEVNNLTVIDEASSALIETAGLKLRLFGLGGAVALHKMFDNGEGFATIAGGQGTMWTTALQMGELVDTAQRVYDPTETRVLVTSAPISRTGLLSLLALSIKADLTISGGLHFRYPASFNDFAVSGDFEAYRQKLIAARDSFQGVYDVVKDRVEGSLNEHQQLLLKKVLATIQKVPTSDDSTWTNTWHWVLTDALCGHLLFRITDGRVSAEMSSNGLNFAHRANQGQAPPSAPLQPSSAATAPAPRPTVTELGKPGSGVPPKPAAAPVAPKPVPPKPITAPVKPDTQLPRPPRGPTGIVPSPSLPPAPKSAENKTPTSKDLALPKSNKSTPSAGPVPLPREKELKKSEKTNGGDKNEAGAESDTSKTTPATPKRFSLFIKGLAPPTSESDVRDFFGEFADKIVGIKIPYDTVKQRQKAFCYVDFANETDCQEALKAHTGGTIGEGTVTVEVSNPPNRNNNLNAADRPIRGGRAMRQQQRSGRGGSASSKDAIKPEGGDKKPESKSETPKPDTQKKEDK